MVPMMTHLTTTAGRTSDKRTTTTDVLEAAKHFFQWRSVESVKKIKELVGKTSEGGSRGMRMSV